ncbi:hypothetical protein CCR75_003000 [Bremia lactucae]|uniref:Uncharacterized protein n=1 Tax=Bremia lactucae TaxID=4779 RepID=A0A976IB80_BRELC|nr:hypothetical protein CCR75_003000 [Bremia lactucae]
MFIVLAPPPAFRASIPIDDIIRSAPYGGLPYTQRVITLSHVSYIRAQKVRAHFGLLDKEA